MDDNTLFSEAEVSPLERRGTRSLLAISPELQAVVASAKSKDAAWKLLRAVGYGFLGMIPVFALAIEAIKFFTGK